MTYTLTRIHTCTHVHTCMKWNSYPADYIYQIQRITSAETGVCSHVWLMIFTAMAITGKLRTSSLTHISLWWCHVYPLGMIIQGGKMSRITLQTTEINTRQILPYSNKHSPALSLKQITFCKNCVWFFKSDKNWIIENTF